MYPLPRVFNTQVQLLLSESDGDRLTGEVLVSTRLTECSTLIATEHPHTVFPLAVNQPHHTLHI